jgi:hypothetical protein
MSDTIDVIAHSDLSDSDLNAKDVATGGEGT